MSAHENHLAAPQIFLDPVTEFLSKFLSLGVAAERLREAQAAGDLVIIPSADAIKIESEPAYIDRRGEEDITAAGLVIMALICFLLFFVTLITGGL